MKSSPTLCIIRISLVIKRKTLIKCLPLSWWWGSVLKEILYFRSSNAFTKTLMMRTNVEINTFSGVQMPLPRPWHWKKGRRLLGPVRPCNLQVGGPLISSKCMFKSIFCETQPPASDGWVALSSDIVRLSRIRDISSHLHYMIFPSIQTIYILWGNDPGSMQTCKKREIQHKRIFPPQKLAQKTRKLRQSLICDKTA